jgi:hypothetical protein
MIGTRRSGRRVIAVLASASLGCALAVAAAGTAQATVPDAWGFALVTSPSGPVNATHWAESVPSPTPAAAASGPGQEIIKFPKIGFFKGGVVHVTAISSPAGPQLAWCQAQSWRPLGGSEFVRVRCYRKGGVPVFVPFTVMFSASSGTVPGALAYAYMHDSPSGVVSSFNSAGMPNTVTAVAPGVWRVRLHGPGLATPAGGVQVTAVNKTAAAICDVGGRGSTPSEQDVIVRCYNAAGVPMKTGWTLSFQRARAITGAKPKFFAYTANNMPGAPAYVPAPPAVNFNSAAGVNSISNSPGISLVKFPHVGLLPNTVFVTAVSGAARICNLNDVWATAAGDVIVRDVVCWNPAGSMTPTRSFVSYASRS